MRRSNLIGGIGGIAFGVLTVLTLLVASPAGGTYTPSDVRSYVASGHHTAVFVGLYLVTIAILGLLLLLVRLREIISGAGDEDLWMANAFWSIGLAAAICLAAGWAVDLAAPIAYAFAGSGFSISTSQTYAIIQIGNSIVFGPGGILLSSALIALFVGGQRALPVWLRWVTLIAGVLGLASPAFFPWFALLIWGAVIGIWLLASGRAST